ncbi:MAG TPA: family 78 glycoside hydrolase catalytic domain [Chitinophagaceae bacterium]|jgi:alpha-L-rhamnosidase|nr:family 78 glycoside hydrolase catalytic domain [Chitinophagaceae bacterium]
MQSFPSAIRKWVQLLICLQLCLISFGQVKVMNLLCENLSNPIGIDVLQPRFSWQLTSDKRNLLQTAYEIRAGRDALSLSKNKDLIWNTGKINSDSSVHVAYKGSPLQADAKYFWQVRVWDNFGKASGWSEPAFWQMGLLTAGDWKAKWIEPGFIEDSINRPTPLFRKEFKAAKKIQLATAYITAHGMYEGYINGKRIGDFYLTPGWTSYNKRLQYQSYDVTNLLNQGSNVIAMGLGSGWYRGYLAWNGNKNSYGKEIALLFQLNITYDDGSKELIVSDGSWKSTTGSITYSEIYHGEIIDARKQRTGWRMTGYDDTNWSGVMVKDHNKSNLIATQNEPVKKHEAFKATKILTTPKGEKVVDFGQNLVGWVIVTAKGNVGDTITISHAEVLDKQGNFYTENLRAAKAQTKYVLRGEGEELFEPHFTFFGFRYIKIEGYRGEIKPENFTAVALYSDMQPTGSFTCSDPLINQLQHNIQWGQKGNFLDVPTDCPQRDERLGWTGDAQVFSRTASFNMNVNNFFAKWLKDVAADQFESGSVPYVIPNVLGPRAGGSTGWADVCTIIPWNTYLVYGDKKILEQQYSSMKAWVEYMKNQSKNDLWNTGFHFGDWLFYRPFDDNDGRSAVTDKYLIAQCFYAYSTQLVVNTANVLGKKDDAATYSALLQKIKAAFLKEYVTENGRLVSSTQTAYVLALNFDMLPEQQRAETAQRLADNVKSYGNHLTTGFLGTPYLCHVLTRFGYDSVAYKLLLQKTYPSWLYPVKMGATTIWERWDGIKPDSSFETPSMNSFNHYSYGAIGDWMYRAAAGIDTYADAPGYKHIKIMPHLSDSLTYAYGDLKTYYGNVSSHWKKDDKNLQLDVEIPANTRATVYIPAVSVESVKENNIALASVSDIKMIGKEGSYVVVELGSGKYHFTSIVQ